MADPEDPAVIVFTLVETRLFESSAAGINDVSFAPLNGPAVSFVKVNRSRTFAPRLVEIFEVRAVSVTTPSRPAAPVSPFGPGIP